MIVYQTHIVTCGPLYSFENHAFSLQQLKRLYIARQVFVSPADPEEHRHAVSHYIIAHVIQ